GDTITAWCDLLRKFHMRPELYRQAACSIPAHTNHDASPWCRRSTGWNVPGEFLPAHAPGWRENQSGAEMSSKTEVAGTNGMGDSSWAESATLIDRNRSSRRDD